MSSLSVYILFMFIVNVESTTEEFNCTEITFQIRFNVVGADSWEVMNFTEMDYILSFYSALCEDTTYHYELTTFDNGTINTVWWDTFFSNNLNSLDYSDTYNCQGQHQNFTCIRMKRSSQCADDLVPAKFRVTFLCAKTSIEICPKPGQSLQIVNFNDMTTLVTTPCIILTTLMTSCGMTLALSSTDITTPISSESIKTFLSAPTLAPSIDIVTSFATITGEFTYTSLAQTNTPGTHYSTHYVTQTQSTMSSMTSVSPSCVTTSYNSQDSDAIPSHIVAIVVSILSVALLISSAVIICLFVRLRRLKRTYTIHSPDSLPCLTASTYL